MERWREMGCVVEEVGGGGEGWGCVWMKKWDNQSLWFLILFVMYAVILFLSITNFGCLF